MDVTRRMTELLGEEGEALAQNAEAMLDNTGDLAQKAANVLIVGLQNDLPDDPEQAIDVLLDICKQLRQKKILLQRAARKMRSTSRAMGVLRAVKAGY